MTSTLSPPGGASTAAPPASEPDPRGARERTRRPHLDHTMVLALVAALVTWLAMLSWRVFTETPGRFLVPLLVLAVVVSGTGIALRALRAPAALVVALQTLVGGFVTLVQVAGFAPDGDGWWGGAGDALRLALDSAQAYAAPVPIEAPPIEPLLLVGGLVCLLLVDVCAGTLQRVALAGLPLLTVYTVPISLTGLGVSWWVFALVALGFVLMLFLQQRAETTRWGRALDGDDGPGFSLRSDDVGNTALGLGALATVLALAVSAVVPTIGLTFFSGGLGQGNGGDIEIENPITDLRRDLHRGEDIDVLSVITSDPDPSYLRIAALTRFNGDEWSSGDRDVPQDQLAQGAMPALQGVGSDVERVDYDYEVSTRESFDSIWLPTAPQISTIDAAGDWRYDTSTMDFLSGDKDQRASGLRYTFTKVDVRPSAEAMAAASVTTGVESRFTQLPGNLPPSIRELARQVTANAPTRFQRAVALQDWFRHSGGFTYSLEDTGDGDLLSFLGDDVDSRIGYCEQFASAMAVMARTLNIPARVAVGFLTPQQIGPNRWQFSTHDMHAWPELFFPGAGWVRFEPTPAGRAPEVPGYTTQRLPEVEDSATPSASAQPSDDVPSRGADVVDEPADDAAEDGSGGAAVDWRWVAGGVGGLFVLLALAWTPRVVRRVRRERRWHRLSPAEAAWAELRDSAVDQGVPWPEAASPRATATAVAAYFGASGAEASAPRPRRAAALAPEAGSALHRIVAAVELARYARPGTAAAGDLRADVETCADAWADGAGPRTRRRARWWPASVVRRRKVTPARESAEVERRDRVVDHVG